MTELPELISRVVDLEITIEELKRQLYRTKDSLRKSILDSTGVSFVTNENGQKTAYVEMPDGDVYQLTVAGLTHGLFLTKLPVTKLNDEN